MPISELIQIKPSGFKQAFSWFTENENYTFRCLVSLRPLFIQRDSVRNIYSIQIHSEREFLIEYEKHQLLNHAKITGEQLRESELLPKFHPIEINYPFVFKKVRALYLKWALLVSPTVTLLVVSAFFIASIAKIKQAWIGSINDGFWLVSSFCAVKCSKDFAQWVLMLIYFHGLLAIALFWGPLHYMLSYRFHKIAAHRFVGFVESSLLFFMGLTFCFVNIDVPRIERAIQMYADYRQGDYGRNQIKELSSQTPEPALKAPAPTASKDAVNFLPKSKARTSASSPREKVKTDSPPPSEPEDSF